MDENERRAFGEEIRMMRKSRNLKQSDVAEASGVSVRTIRNLEAGRVELQPGNLAAVLDAVGYQRPAKPWDDDVDAFLQMLGWRLSRLDQRARSVLIADLTLRAIGHSPDAPAGQVSPSAPPVRMNGHDEQQ